MQRDKHLDSIRFMKIKIIRIVSVEEAEVNLLLFIILCLGEQIIYVESSAANRYIME